MWRSPAAEPVTGAPVAWMVAERRGGRWVFGDDWSRVCDSLAEAEQVAERWAGFDDRGVGVFALVPVATRMCCSISANNSEVI